MDRLARDERGCPPATSVPGCCDGQHSPEFVPFPLRLVTIGQAFKVLEGSESCIGDSVKLLSDLKRSGNSCLFFGGGHVDFVIRSKFLLK